MKGPVSMEMRAAAHKQENEGGGGSGCPLWCFGLAHCKMSSMATQTERMTSDDGRSHRTLGSNRIKRLDAGGINQEVVPVKNSTFRGKVAENESENRR